MAAVRVVFLFRHFGSGVGRGKEVRNGRWVCSRREGEGRLNYSKWKCSGQRRLETITINLALATSVSVGAGEGMAGNAVKHELLTMAPNKAPCAVFCSSFVFGAPSLFPLASASRIREDVPELVQYETMLQQCDVHSFLSLKFSDF